MKSHFKRPKSISITSGKGGVGKSSLVCNIASECASKGERILLLDGDLGLSNLDLMFGVQPRGTIDEVLAGTRELAEIVTPVGKNIDLVSTGSGVTTYNKYNSFERRTLVNTLASLEKSYDLFLIDTGPGISDNVLFLNTASEKIVVVLTPELSSLADSYALIKLLNRDFGEKKFCIVCNQVKDEADGLNLYRRICDLAGKFLNVSLDYGGFVQLDANFKRSSYTNKVLSLTETDSAAVKQIRNISKNLRAEQDQTFKKGGLQYFWEQVVGVA